LDVAPTTTAGATGMSEADYGPFGRRLTPDEATAAGYVDLAIREDDGTVQAMHTTNGYRITYGAPSYRSAVRAVLQEQSK
jgi:hypothetical protein